MAKVTYTPGYRFELYAHPFRGVMLLVLADVIDSNTGEPTTLGPRHNVPNIAQRSAADFHEWLFWLLGTTVMHEHAEAYRVDGKPLHDPHADDWPELTGI